MLRPIPWIATARVLSAALLLVALSFLSASTYLQHRQSRILTAAIDITSNAAPSIHELAAARTDLAHLRLVIRQEIQNRKDRRPPNGDALAQLQRSIDGHLRRYLALPNRPEEHDLWTSLKRQVTSLDRQFAMLSDQLAAHQEEAADQALRAELDPTLQQTADEILRLVELNTTFIRDDALAIMGIRQRARRLNLMLNLLSLGSSVAVALLLTRTLRRFAVIDAENERLRALHADELERVSQRMAHDIRSPLATIALAFEIIQRSKIDEQARRACERGARSLGRASRIVSDLLAFARAGAQPDPMGRAALDEVLGGVLDDLQHAAQEARVTIQTEVAPLLLACTPGLLSCVLSNLITNAIKYMGQAKVRRIHVVASSRGARARIEVHDTGPGIPTAYLGRIFNPYVRGPETNQPGLGLGLATVQRICHSHGGVIGVDSREGQGAVFWLELPLVRPNPPHEAPVLAAPGTAHRTASP